MATAVTQHVPNNRARRRLNICTPLEALLPLAKRDWPMRSLFLGWYKPVSEPDPALEPSFRVIGKVLV